MLPEYELEISGLVRGSVRRYGAKIALGFEEAWIVMAPAIGAPSPNAV